MRVEHALTLIYDELTKAQEDWPPMNTVHEGYALILEELDELWDEIKMGKGTTREAASEAVQTAAMSLRYLVDLCPDMEDTA